MTRRIALLLSALVLAGCSSYTWKSTVPEEMRTVSVPTFRNESDVTELGAVVTAQLAREFQREGTFSLRRTGAAALEVQGVIESAVTGARGYRRRSGMRYSEFVMTMKAKVSLIDKSRSLVLIDNREYTAETTFSASGDVLTGERNASGRLAEDLARQVVDDVIAYDYGRDGRKEAGDEAK